MPRHKKSNDNVKYSSSSESVYRDVAGNIQYAGTTAATAWRSFRQNNSNEQVNRDAVHMFDKLPEPEPNSEEGKSYTLGDSDTDSEQVNSFKNLSANEEPKMQTNTDASRPFPRAINKLKKVFLEQKLDIEVQFDENDYRPAGVPWSYGLVGYVVGSFPGKQALLQCCKNWGVKFRYAPHESKWLVFTFQNEEDRKMVLENGPYFVFNRPFILKILPPLFDFKNQELREVPVWVRIRKLPLELWTSTALSKILSVIGNPVRMDHRTAEASAVSYARALVEINVSKDLVNEIKVRLIDNTLLKLDIDFENIPPFCNTCLFIGHETSKCGEKKKSVFNSNRKQGKKQGNIDVAVFTAKDSLRINGDHSKQKKGRQSAVQYAAKKVPDGSANANDVIVEEGLNMVSDISAKEPTVAGKFPNFRQLTEPVSAENTKDKTKCCNQVQTTSSANQNELQQGAAAESLTGGQNSLLGCHHTRIATGTHSKGSLNADQENNHTVTGAVQSIATVKTNYAINQLKVYDTENNLVDCQIKMKHIGNQKPDCELQCTLDTDSAKVNEAQGDEGDADLLDSRYSELVVAECNMQNLKYVAATDSFSDGGSDSDTDDSTCRNQCQNTKSKKLQETTKYKKKTKKSKKGKSSSKAVRNFAKPKCTSANAGCNLKQSKKDCHLQRPKTIGTANVQIATGSAKSFSPECSIKHPASPEDHSIHSMKSEVNVQMYAKDATVNEQTANCSVQCYVNPFTKANLMEDVAVDGVFKSSNTASVSGGAINCDAAKHKHQPEHVISACAGAVFDEKLQENIRTTKAKDRTKKSKQSEVALDGLSSLFSENDEVDGVFVRGHIKSASGGYRKQHDEAEIEMTNVKHEIRVQHSAEDEEFMSANRRTEGKKSRTAHHKPGKTTEKLKTSLHSKIKQHGQFKKRAHNVTALVNAKGALVGLRKQ